MHPENTESFTAGTLPDLTQVSLHLAGPDLYPL